MRVVTTFNYNLEINCLSKYILMKFTKNMMFTLIKEI